MSRVIGIICEYNPFHNGHKYQIEQIRANEPDATILAVMSGNVVQRGEFAMIDKKERAKIALENGVNAVFELPYPYSASTAEIFANAGVEIVSKLGCDALYFGTEKESLEKLEKIAEIVDTPEFKKELDISISENDDSFIAVKESTLKKFGAVLPKNANDMLAIEYIRAIKRKKLNIEYHSIKRIGSFYNDEELGEVMSASGIRKHFYKSYEILSVPSVPYYEEIANKGKYLDIEAANRCLHSFVLANSNRKIKAFDTSLEMTSLIIEKDKNSCNGEEFMNKLSSKAFTTARLKRSILYALFGVNKVDFEPKFTVLLGMDKKGREHLNKVKKEMNFTVITKHSDARCLKKRAGEIFKCSYLVDEFYNTLLVNPLPPIDAYKTKPTIKTK